ncbi:MAG: alpha/beta hydrolase [Bacteroidales bacterium]|nr:alpha/beta hydrolase [Bacteroidales bacterium]
MEEHRTIEFRGRRIHYRDEGRNNERTLVLLHGFLQSQDVWSSYTLSYMRSMRVVTIDLPGFGYSDTYGEVHTMEFMAEAVKAVLDAADVDQCVMAGHSMGGYVALAFANNYYYSLRGLALLNSHALADSEDCRSRREEDCRKASLNRAEYILGFIDSLFDPSKRKTLNQDVKDLQDQCLDTRLEGLVAAQKGMAVRPDRVGVLQRFEMPTLFIYGKNDTRNNLDLCVSQAMEAQHAEILLLSNVGHMCFMEERDYVKPRLKNFVETCYY